MDINITQMHLDGHPVPVPSGLSDLINRAGAWSVEEIPPLDVDYKRDVTRVDGRLVTRLIYVGSAREQGR